MDMPHPVAVMADQVPPRMVPSNYPEPFATRMQGRIKCALGNVFGLSNFGVNLTTLKPGSISALRHSHSVQDEFIYILEGAPTLVTDDGETLLQPGMCAGFPSGSQNGHHLVNRSGSDVVYLEIGDRSRGDSVLYPDDDLKAVFEDGAWHFLHKDGRPYSK